MSDIPTLPDYREIANLSNRELAKRTKVALEAFIQAVKQGGNVVEKEQLHGAYEDERLKRLNAKKKQ